MTEQQQSRQALDWLIVLHDRPHDGEIRKRFDAWQSSSAANAMAWDKAQRLWNLIGDTLPAHADTWTVLTASTASTELNPVLPDPSIRQSRRGPRYWGPVAALVVGLAACLVLVLPSTRIYWQAQHHTGIGETALVKLRDGSTVHLGANSAIRESDDPASRHVDLLKGQAFFEIIPDPSRPFQVSAAEWRTTVLGTAFDINLTSHAASVAVEHGSVSVDRADGSSIQQKLETGDWIRVEHNRGITTQGHGQPSQVAAWRQSRLVVKSRPIDEVIGELERYHRGVIVVIDADLKTRLVSGVYDLHHPIEALRAVVQPHQAVVRELTPYLVIVSSS